MATPIEPIIAFGIAAKPAARETSTDAIAGLLMLDGPQVLLASDFPRTASLAADYQSRELQLPTRLIEQLSQLAHGAPRFSSIWLAAWGSVLFRFTDQAQFQLDVVTGDSELDGNSFKSLTLCFDSEVTGRDLAVSIETALNSRSTAETQYPAATAGASVLICPANLAPAVVVQSTCRNLPPGRELHLLYVRQDDLSQAHIVYNAALFGPDTIVRLAHHLSLLLKGIVAQLDRRVCSLPLLTDQETQACLTNWRGVSESYPQVPLHRYVESHAAKTPEAIAVTFRSQHLTYEQLNRQANQIAHYLVAHGVGAGTPVAVHVGGSADALVCALGIFKAGGIYVPLDPTYPIQRLAVVLDDTRPKVIVSQCVLPPEISDKAPTNFIFDRERESLGNYSSENMPLDPDLQQAAFIIYTSGTTGKPKGVMLSHANLIHYLLVARDRYGYTAADVIPAFARFTFSITMFEVLSPLIAGARLIILERDLVLDFARLTQTLRQVTAFHASPSLLRRLLAYIEEARLDLGMFARLRHVSSGGDVVSPDLIENLKRTFNGAEIFVIYGSSEISCMGCTYAVPTDRTVTRSYVGKPFPNVVVRVYDTQRNLVPVGVPGEIYFGGAGVAIGYLNAPDITREKFVEIDGERFYRMGDLGRFDADGNLEFLGRNDFQIKLRGMRIELLEIETTLRRMAGVLEAVVAERPFPAGEKGLVAYFVLDQEQPPSKAEIRRWLQKQLPDYMVPSAFVELVALPVNFNQKLDRKALPLPAADDFRNLGDYVAPRNPTEERLTAIWEALLKMHRVGVRDSFFDAGGDSLLSIDLVVQIEKAFGKTLPLSVVLTEPTIERLATLLESDGSRSTGVVLLREGGPSPPIFLVHDGEGEILPYRKLAYALPASRPIYGVTPLSRGECPMLHTRLADVVDYYTSQIVAMQPRGPYTLGGLCIGGFIAYEIARKLRTAGQEVELVALIDAAHVNAPVQSINVKRVARFVATMHPVKSGRRSFPSMIRKAGRKLVNFSLYVAKDRIERLANHSRVRLFRVCLDRNWPVPRLVRRIPVRVLLRFAEKEYVTPDPYDGKVLLLRATQKDPALEGTPIDDTPYIDLFEEPLMGWEKQLSRLKVYDLRGGHSSMLQDPNVVDVANAMVSNLNS